MYNLSHSLSLSPSHSLSLSLAFFTLCVTLSHYFYFYKSSTAYLKGWCIPCLTLCRWNTPPLSLSLSLFLSLSLSIFLFLSLSLNISIFTSQSRLISKAGLYHDLLDVVERTSTPLSFSFSVSLSLSLLHSLFFPAIHTFLLFTPRSIPIFQQ